MSFDLSKASNAERRAMEDRCSDNLLGSQGFMTLMTKICTPVKIQNDTMTTYPGLEGIRTAHSRKVGRSIKLQDVTVRPKTIQAQDLENSFSISRKQVQRWQGIDDPINAITMEVANAWVATIELALIEYMTDNLGYWDILDGNTDILGFDGKATFATDHYDGVLSNTTASSGVGPANVKKDFYTIWRQLFSANKPGSNRKFWGSTTMAELDIVFWYPLEMEDVMANVFGAEQFVTIVDGVPFNAPSQNILAKEGYIGKPTMIPSGYLSELSDNTWYVIFSNKGIAPGTAAFDFYFNPYTDPEVNKTAPNEITFGDVTGTGANMFCMEYLGQGTPNWVNDYKAIISGKTTAVPFISQPYRVGRVLGA